MLKNLSLILLLSLSSLALAQQSETPYAMVEPAQPTSSKNKVEVVEIFSYMCPHCHHLEPYIADWVSKAPEHVRFERMPAEFNRKSWVPVARMYYTAEILGFIEDVHLDIFERIHGDKKFFRSVDDVVDFLASYGKDADTIRSTYHSFAVETKLRRAQTMISRYGITGVPAVIVNGKYRTNASMAGGYPKQMEIISSLVAKEAQLMGLIEGA